MVKFENIADLPDPSDSQDRSYREVNTEKIHKIPLNTLVQVETGERLYIMQHTRDCDQTPLYSIGMIDSSDWTWNHGYAEENLEIIKK